MSQKTVRIPSGPAAAPDAPPEDGAIQAGTVLDGRYRLGRLIGAGGMGKVYEAEHVHIGRAVAVKILHPRLTGSRVDVERFQREARIAVRLSSPHVVEMIDFGRTPRDQLYLVMELLRGESLGAQLEREGRFQPEHVTALMRQLLAGLAAAHDAGIVHRDLKPENLWLVPADGGTRLKILDFGIAKVSDLPDGAARTQAGLVMGTPEYLSPEQAVGGEIDARSDLYSAGIIAWVLLTGRHPFPRPSVRELVRAHAFEPVPSPDREVPGLAAHPALLRFVARATEKDRDARAQTASELLAILDGRESRLRWTTPPTPAPAGGATPSPAPSASTRLSGLVRPVAGVPRVVGATLLVTGIVDYAEFRTRQSASAHARMLVAHDEIVLPPIRAFHGRRVRSLDDTVLAAFASPTNAVLCGMAIQDRLAGHLAAGGAGEPFALRIGIHLGESRPRGGDLAGEAVDVALAARRAGAPGEVCLTRTVYLAMNHSEAAVEPRPAIAVPSRDEPMPLYRATRVGGPLPYGGRESARVTSGERVSRALAPLADGIASIEEGAAEGRLRVATRVLGAAAALCSLAALDATARTGLLALAAVRWIAWRGRPPAPFVERQARRLEALRGWIRERRPVHRAALTRPLS